MAMDPDKLIPDHSLSIREGAILPWKNYFIGKGQDQEGSWSYERFQAMEKQWKIDFDRPWKDLPKKHKDLILYGGNKTLKVTWEGEKSSGTWEQEYEGLVHSYMRRYLKTKSDGMKTWYQKFMSSSHCSSCKGARLKKEVLAVKVGGESIMDICSLSIADALSFFKSLKLSGNREIIAKELVKEILNRLSFLVNVGLGYLSLDRYGPSLSGGEAQRIRLASQIGCELTGVLYILDEPSIGLHQRDNRKLLDTLCHLRDLGNSLIVVEHDEETIAAADWIVDFGPGAGVEGGSITASGTPAAVKRNRKSLTGKYISGKKTIEIPESRRVFEKSTPTIEILGATRIIFEMLM